MGARNRVGIEFSYRPARLHSLAELVLGIDSWAPLKFKNPISEVVSREAEGRRELAQHGIQKGRQ